MIHLRQCKDKLECILLGLNKLPIDDNTDILMVHYEKWKNKVNVI